MTLLSNRQLVNFGKKLQQEHKFDFLSPKEFMNYCNENFPHESNLSSFLLLYKNHLNVKGLKEFENKDWISLQTRIEIPLYKFILTLLFSKSQKSNCQLVFLRLYCEFRGTKKHLFKFKNETKELTSKKTVLRK